MRHPALVLGAALALVALVSSPAGAGGRGPGNRRLERAVAHIVTVPDGPPGIVVVVQDGHDRPRYITAGVADRETGARIRSDDHLRLASVSKAFSGAVALSLVADGHLSLDSTIGTVLPALPIGWHAVTLRQLLNHTSRIPDFSTAPTFLDALLASLTVAPPPAELLSFVEDTDPPLVPGRGYLYSNSDNIIVALMATAVTGVPYEDLLQTRVYDRLGLARTSLPSGPELPVPNVSGYDVSRPELPEDVSELFAAGWTYASGGVVSTAADANRFVRGYAAGRTTDRPTLKAQRAFIPNASSEPPGPGRNSAGLAIFRYDTRCGTVYGHTGNTPGYTNFVAATPDGRRSATVHINAQLTPGAQRGAFRRAARTSSSSRSAQHCRRRI